MRSLFDNSYLKSIFYALLVTLIFLGIPWLAHFFMIFVLSHFFIIDTAMGQYIFGLFCALLVVLYCRRPGLLINIMQLKGALKGLFVYGMPYLLFVGFLFVFLVNYMYTSRTLTSPFLFNLYRSQLLLFLLMALCSGIYEEVVFRGLIIHKIESLLKNKYLRTNTVFTILISSVFFSLMHFTVIFTDGSGASIAWQFIFSFIVGFYFAVIYLKSKTLIPCMVFHFFWNFTIVSLQFIRENHRLIPRSFLNDLILINNYWLIILFHVFIFLFSILLLVHHLKTSASPFLTTDAKVHTYTLKKICSFMN